MWSVGCILGELLRGKPLFNTALTDSSDQLSNIFEILGLPQMKKRDDANSVLLNYSNLQIVRNNIPIL